MFTITCPKCKDEIEFSMCSDEDWSGRVVGVIDEWARDCSCVFSETEEEDLQRTAAESVTEMDPPGDY